MSTHGFGLCCCEPGGLIYQDGHFPPMYFRSFGDRVFSTGTIDTSVVRMSEYISNDTIDGISVNSTVSDVTWSDFRQCMFGAQDRTFGGGTTSPVTGYSQFWLMEENKSDLRDYRCWDIGDTLYDIPEQHGDFHLRTLNGSTDTGTPQASGDFGVDNGKMYRASNRASNNDFSFNSLDSSHPASGCTIVPHASDSRTISIKMKTTASPSTTYPTCMTSYSDSEGGSVFTASDMLIGGAGVFLRCRNNIVFIKPNFTNDITLQQRWGVQGLSIFPPVGYTPGDEIEIIIYRSGNEIRFEFYLNNMQIMLSGQTYGVLINLPAPTVNDIDMLYYGLTTSNITSSTKPNINSWYIAYADWIRKEVQGGTARTSGRWAGFDVEYDNIEDFNNILYNGRWTLRSGRSAAIRPTSWGMQWPITYTATGLPAGLTISDQGILGTPTGTGSGTATVTATDAQSRTTVTTHNWDIV